MAKDPSPRRQTPATLLRPLLATMFLLCAVWPSSAWSQVFASELQRFRLTILTAGLEHPWGLAFLPDGRMLVSERPGRLRLVDASGRLDPEAIGGLPPVAAVGQGGLLDVVLHPRYRDNGWIYLSYVGAGSGGYSTEVLRARLQGKTLSDVQVLFRMRPRSGGGRHFGSRLVFDRQGFLFITLGDRGDQQRAQHLDDHAGSVIRLHDDGRIPADNPFVGQAGALPEKFTVGNRNIQGAALHPQTGALWTHEHGPQGGDEINVIAAGANYGWPVITYGREYVTGARIGEGAARADVVAPAWQWTPSIAPSGMAFCTSDRYAGWRGSLFVGSLKFRLLSRLELDGDAVVREERLLTDLGERVRDVRQGPDGLLYLLTDEADGRLLRLEPPA